MLFNEGFTFRNFLADAFSIFMFVVLFWFLIIVFSDLFRRTDISALAKVAWSFVLIVLPYIGVFAYILSQGDGMAERAQAQAKHIQDNLRHVVGFSAADEIDKLTRLKAAGTISDQEFGRLRARLVQ